MALPTEFTDCDIKSIGRVLPPNADPRRTALLGPILREWARVELRRHLSGDEPLPVLRQRRERIAKIGKLAAQLAGELDQLDGAGRASLTSALGLVAGQTLLGSWGNAENYRRLSDGHGLIEALVMAARLPGWKPGPGHPPNRMAERVLADLAAIFEYVTALSATRRVSWDGGAEYGPFRDFVAAIWPILFGNDASLSSTLRKWSGRKPSAVIAAINRRRPQWGLFGEPGKIVPIS